MRVILTISLLSFIYCTSSKAQTFTSTYFEDTEWATTAKDSSFFKEDTIVIVKTTTDSNLLNSESLNVSSYFNNTDYFSLEFETNNRLNFSIHRIDTWSVSTLKGKYTWNYDSKENLLNLYFNKTMLASFEPISGSKRIVEIASNYLNRPKLRTFEISLKRRPY